MAGGMWGRVQIEDHILMAGGMPRARTVRCGLKGSDQEASAHGDGHVAR